MQSVCFYSGCKCTQLSAICIEWKISKENTNQWKFLSAIILNAGNEGKHTIWIYKATEATTVPIFIYKIVTENIKSLSNPSLPLIEFISNRITCGTCADDPEVPCGTGVYHDQHNAYFAYC